MPASNRTNEIYDLSADMHMMLPSNRYFFSISAQGLPQDFAFDPFLFLQKEHLETQSEDELCFFQLLDQKTDRIVAHLPVFINQNGLAYSPGRAPFGSVQFKNKLREVVVAEFLENTKRYLLEEKNCHTIRFKSYPFAYDPAQSAILTDLLLKQNYSISHSEINHHLAIDDKPLHEKMYRKTRWGLTKCKNSGFVFKEEVTDSLDEAFNFINLCQTEKGYKLSLKFEALNNLFQSFPQRFRTFWVYRDEEPAACCISILVNKSILYNFYLASKSSFNQYSPAVLLINGLYQFCQQEGIALLDLGTSNLQLWPNFPLIAFKKHLGGEPTLKLSFEFKR